MRLTKEIEDRIYWEVEWFDGIKCQSVYYLESTEKAMICQAEFEEPVFIREEGTEFLISTEEFTPATMWYVITADGIYHEHCFKQHAYDDYRSVR